MGQDQVLEQYLSHYNKVSGQMLKMSKYSFCYCPFYWAAEWSIEVITSLSNEEKQKGLFSLW